jgi:hypothetical protein
MDMTARRTRGLGALVVSALIGTPLTALPGEWPPPWVVAAQSTVVWQHLPDFRRPYAGGRSLRAGPDDAVSHSYTLYTGMRVLPWLDVYADPEMIRGEGIGGGTGLAGYTNGEVIRNPQAGQAPYLARAFLRATIPLGESTEPTEPDLLQVGGVEPTRRIVLTGGVLAAADVFDTNRYANSTRTQFLNWSFLNDTAWDFAADTRGYTRGGAVEWIDDGWAVRAGAFQMPAVANGLDLDGDLLHSNGEQIEVEGRPTLLADRPTVVRGMAYLNHARMGSYRAALALAGRTRSTPDVTRTRTSDASKYGFTLNVEQPLTRDGETGLFARAGWNDGATETFCFTEADWALSAGAQVGGGAWRRGDDRLGAAVAVNGLSAAHRDYLAAGGLGFELGDGKLAYRPETIVEAYYLVQPLRWAAVTVDYQLVADPGDNRARGPVSVVSIRVHLQHTIGQPG